MPRGVLLSSTDSQVHARSGAAGSSGTKSVSSLDQRVRIAARRAGQGVGALCVAAYALIVLGAIVRAQGAGLACPDWPLCFGRVVPDFDAKVALEWGHRALAGLVSLGLAGASAYLIRIPELRGLVARALVVAWALLGTQVVLGGLTVLLGLAPWTVTAHLLVGNAFCGTLFWIARDLGEAGRLASRERRRLPASISLAVALCGALLVGQLVLGGLVSGHYAGLACSAFPTCDGHSVAPTFSGLIGLHVLHRLNALALALACIGLVWVTRGAGRVSSYAWVSLHLVVAQIAAGVVNVLGQLPVEITALHSALAAALVLTLALVAREAWESQSAAAPAESSLGHAMESVG